MRVLVVAVSARMLAQLASADGHEVTALDRFGDVDLRAVACGSATADSNDALANLAARVDVDAVVYGAGFENRPDLVARMAEGRELLGTPAEGLAPVRDPRAVAAAARGAGARAPETRSVTEVPSAGVRGVWLRKPLRSGGGRGVRTWAGGRVAETEILQRRIAGLSCSAVAIGDGRRAAMLGLTEQLHRRPGFGWMGNVSPPRLPDGEVAELDGQLRAVCDEVAARFGVRGAFGVDAVWDGHHAWVLEVNPRPPASLELFGAGLVRGARPRGTGHRPSVRRHAPGDAVCEGEASAVRRPRPSRPGSGLVAGGARARHPSRRRDHQAGVTRVHAGFDHRWRTRALRTRRPLSVVAYRRRARPWLSSARSPAPGVVCCATT